MEFPILSYVGAGPLRFGMNISQIRTAMGCPAKPFMKGPDAVMFTDAFRSAGVHASYKPPGVCDAIEFWGHAVPTLFGRRLLGVSAADVQRMLREWDAQLELDDVGFTSYALGVAIYCPAYLELPDEPIEGVLAFERGYYERGRSVN